MLFRKAFFCGSVQKTQCSVFHFHMYPCGLIAFQPFVIKRLADLILIMRPLSHRVWNAWRSKYFTDGCHCWRHIGPIRDAAAYGEKRTVQQRRSEERRVGK